MQIEEVVFYTIDMVLVKNFYAGTLGLTIKDNTAVEISFLAGRTILIFKKTNHSNPYYHFAFNIEPEQIERAHKWLKERVEIVKFMSLDVLPFPKWNAKSIYFFDPLGNILEFIARADLPKGNKGSFDSSCITSISEVGIVADPVFEIKTVLEEEYGIFPFKKDAPTNKFCPMGDDHGLLIVVTENRNWFPTDKPCKKFPLTVKIKNTAGELKVLEIKV